MDAHDIVALPGGPLRFRQLGLLLLGALLACPRPVAAQAVGGSLQGVVTDPSGAAVRGADVVVRNTATGDARALATDGAGRYHVPLLPPGEYEIRASTRGFRPIVRRGVQLAVGETVVIDLALEVGSIETAVTVTGEPPRINLANGSVSGLVDDHQLSLIHI